MTHSHHLYLHESALSARTLAWIFITIVFLLIAVAIGIFRSATEVMKVLNDQEHIRAIEFWIHCS